MGHGHSHHAHSHSDQEDSVPKSLIRAMGVTLLFMAVELVGGYWSNSLALLADAAHMLTDVAAMGLSIFAFYLSRRPSTPTMSFGYHRVEILGALASGLLIWLIAGVLVFEAILRLHAPPEVQGPIVFVVAGIGFAANLFSMAMLHSTQRGNLNVRAAYLHLFTDSIGSLAAVIAGAVLWWTGWRPIDAWISIIAAVLMLASSWKLVKESVEILMESTPSHLDPADILGSLRAIPSVVEVHDLHVWTVSSGKWALSAHMISSDAEGVLNQAYELLREKFRIQHTTIQVEHPDKFKSERCYDCAHV